MALSVPAIILAIVYGLCLTIGIVMSVVKHQFNVLTAISFLFSAAFIALLIYDTQCLTAGSCNTWSWIRTILYVIFPVIALLTAFFSLFTKNPNADAIIGIKGPLNLSEQFEEEKQYHSYS